MERPIRIRPDIFSEKCAFPEISRKWKIIRVSEICPFLVLQNLQDHPSHSWGVTLDLKDWFFHLGLHRQTQRSVRVKGHHQSIQMLGLPFGLQCNPFWAHRLCKPMLQHLRGMGFVLCWYVDDTLLLRETPSHVLNCLKYLLQLLTQLGIRVNFPKCNLIPCQPLPFWARFCIWLCEPLPPSH